MHRTSSIIVLIILLLVLPGPTYDFSASAADEASAHMASCCSDTHDERKNYPAEPTETSDHENFDHKSVSFLEKLAPLEVKETYVLYKQRFHLCQDPRSIKFPTRPS